MTKFNHFRRGQSTFNCLVCGKLTRETNGGNGGIELCEFCYEVGGLENSLADGIITEEQFNEEVASLCKQYDRVDASGKPAPKSTTKSNPQHKEQTMTTKSTKTTKTTKNTTAAAKKLMKADLVEMRKAQGVVVNLDARKLEAAQDAAAARGDKKEVARIAKERKATPVKPSLQDLISGKGNAVAAAVAEAASAKAPAKKAHKMKIVDVEPDTIKSSKNFTTHATAKLEAKVGTTEKKETVASFMRRLIVEGKSNEEVFAAAVKVFAIDESKKHYPSWYRSQMRRDANAAKAAAKAK